MEARRAAEPRHRIPYIPIKYHIYRKIQKFGRNPEKWGAEWVGWFSQRIPFFSQDVSVYISGMCQRHPPHFAAEQ
jgi:hypothetical protein